MAKSNKFVVLILIVLSIGAFALFSIPNSKASENLAMITMFEPDESVFFPTVQRMLRPQPDLLNTIGRFIAYGFYSYGFPLFAPTAILYKLLTVFGQAENYPLIMLVMRQMITVLPMLASLWVLVYLQDQFKSWRSIALIVLLLSVPAVVQNGFWWHPDGLVMLVSSLVLYFLWKDNRNFGKHFYLAAVFCGILVSLKVVGFFFFLTIAVVLIWGLGEKKLTWRQFFIKGLFFILIMAGSILLTSLHYLLPNHRELAFTVLKREIFETSKGYGIHYLKGLLSSWPTITTYYGNAVFLLVALAVSIWSLWDQETRFLRALILSWFLPLSVHLLFFSHFKYQYWLPVAIALFSNLAFLLPKAGSKDRQPSRTLTIKTLLVVVVIFQFTLFVIQDSQLFRTQITRLETNPAIQFYEKSKIALAPITQDLSVYYDYRLYMPETPGWFVDTSFDLLNYDYLRERDFSVLFLSNQRISDYTQDGIIGIDPLTFPAAQAFYQDAKLGLIEGYQLLRRDGTASLFVKEELCLQYYKSGQCQ